MATSSNKLLDARATNTPILNESTTPRRYMLKKDDRGDYSLSMAWAPLVGLSASTERTRFTYIAHGMADKCKVDKGDHTRKQSRVVAGTE